MSGVFSFHMHQWEPYHLTEILPFNKEEPYHRLFECCLICGVARIKNLAPGEIPPIIYLPAEES